MAKAPEEPRDPALARFVYERLSAALDRETARAISHRTHVSPGTLSYIKNGRGTYGIGRNVATALLPVLGFKTYEDLLEAAFSAAKGEPASGRLPSRYRSLDELLEENPERWSPPSVAAVRSMRFPTDPGREYWSRTLDVADPLLRALEAQPPPPPGESPLDRVDGMHGTRKKRR